MSDRFSKVIKFAILCYSCWAVVNGGLFSRFWGWKTALVDEMKYRKSSIEQYRDQITNRVQQSIKLFRDEQLYRLYDAQKELDTYILKVNQTYWETIQIMKKQTNSVQELNMKYIRPKYLDRSLEDFKRLYNESMFQNIANKLMPTELRKLQEAESFKPLSLQMNQLNRVLASSWNNIVKSSQESRKDVERLVKVTMQELQQLQEDLTLRASLLEDDVKGVVPSISSKDELRKAREGLDSQLRKLEREGSQWMEERIQSLNTTLKLLQDNVKKSESLFDDLIGKKRANLHYTIMNDVTLKKVLNMIDAKDTGWKLIKEEDGIQVYRKFMAAGLGSQYACVKCHGIIKAAPLKVLDLFEDNTRVREYNTLFEEGRDLEVVAENTKISWASSSPIFPFKARDFCTVVHTRKLKDGTLVVLNRAAKHPDAPVTSKYVRGSIILGANIIQPIPGQSTKCKLTMITQVDPGGFAPPMVINHLCTLGPIGFMKNIEVAANTAPSYKVLQEKKMIAKEKEQKNKKT